MDECKLEKNRCEMSKERVSILVGLSDPFMPMKEVLSTLAAERRQDPDRK